MTLEAPQYPINPIMPVGYALPHVTEQHSPIYNSPVHPEMQLYGARQEEEESLKAAERKKIRDPLFWLALLFASLSVKEKDVPFLFNSELISTGLLGLGMKEYTTFFILNAITYNKLRQTAATEEEFKKEFSREFIHESIDFAMGLSGMYYATRLALQPLAIQFASSLVDHEEEEEEETETT